MHIHSMNFNVNSISSAGAAESAAARQRAADVRKKLMSSDTDLDGVSGPDEANLISRWMNAAHAPLPGEDEYHSSTSSKEQDFEGDAGFRI